MECHRETDVTVHRRQRRCRRSHPGCGGRLSDHLIRLDQRLPHLAPPLARNSGPTALAPSDKANMCSAKTRTPLGHTDSARRYWPTQHAICIRRLPTAPRAVQLDRVSVLYTRAERCRNELTAAWSCPCPPREGQGRHQHGHEELIRLGGSRTGWARGVAWYP